MSELLFRQLKMTPIFKLPSELVCAIVDQLSHVEDIERFTLTCRHIYDLARYPLDRARLLKQEYSHIIVDSDPRMNQQKCDEIYRGHHKYLDTYEFHELVSAEPYIASYMTHVIFHGSDLKSRARSSAPLWSPTPTRLLHEFLLLLRLTDAWFAADDFTVHNDRIVPVKADESRMRDIEVLRRSSFATDELAFMLALNRLHNLQELNISNHNCPMEATLRFGPTLFCYSPLNEPYFPRLHTLRVGGGMDERSILWYHKLMAQPSLQRICLAECDLERFSAFIEAIPSPTWLYHITELKFQNNLMPLTGMKKLWQGMPKLRVLLWPHRAGRALLELPPHVKHLSDEESIRAEEEHNCHVARFLANT